MAINPSNPPVIRFRNYYDNFLLDELLSIGKDGAVYVTSSYPELIALSPDGTIKFKLVGRGEGPLVDENGIIYSSTSNPMGFSAINPNGTIKWTSQHKGANPAIGDDGTIYGRAGVYENIKWRYCIIAINPNGTPKWTCEPFLAGIAISELYIQIV
ncbi:hypothetical protein [Acidihalobacter prosperus]